MSKVTSIFEIKKALKLTKFSNLNHKSHKSFC